MANARHAAAYLAEVLDKTVIAQLQVLLYYAQGCHLALHDEELFDDPIEAWSRGPAVRSLWPGHHRLHELKSPWPDAKILDQARTELSTDAIGTLNAVSGVLGGWTADALAESAQHENPWLSARGDLPTEAYSQAELDLRAVREYFVPVCLASRRELTRDELSPAAYELSMHFAHIRAFTPATVKAADVEAWFEALEAPPRDLPDLREFLNSTRARSQA